MNSTMGAVLHDESSESSLPSWMENFKQTTDVGRGIKPKQVLLIDSDSEDDEPDVAKSQPLAAIDHVVVDMTQQELNKNTLLGSQREKGRMVKGEEVNTANGERPAAVATPSGATQQENTGDCTQQEALKRETTIKAMEPKIADASWLPVVAPDRMNTSKMLLELQSNDVVAGSTDLSGDSGTIGRILIRTAQEAGENRQKAELDLKGLIYSMTPVEYPGTLMVLHMGPSEAKVECIYDSFVQLREDKRFSDEGAAKIKEWLDEDDDTEVGPAQEGIEVQEVGKTASGPKKKGGAAAARPKKGQGGILAPTKGVKKKAAQRKRAPRKK